MGYKTSLFLPFLECCPICCCFFITASTTIIIAVGVCVPLTLIIIIIIIVVAAVLVCRRRRVRRSFTTTVAYSGVPQTVQFLDGVKQSGSGAGYLPLTVPGDVPPYPMAIGCLGPPLPVGPQPGGVYLPPFGDSDTDQ